jgi:hypothetical protein
LSTDKKYIKQIETVREMWQKNLFKRNGWLGEREREGEEE